MKIVDAILEKLGYVRSSSVKEKLNFAYSVGKRLDEHRESVETIERETNLFQLAYWHPCHMATQDDYLMRLYHLVHECWPDNERELQPTGEVVRPRPQILGPCGLPEYQERSNSLSTR